MPTYEYRCPKCGHQYEALQKISDKARAKCPKCGTRGERLISGGAGLVFKGSGFYITDYKRAGEKRPDEGGSGATTTEKADKPDKAEKADKSGKPAAKPEKPAKKKPGAES